MPDFTQLPTFTDPLSAFGVGDLVWDGETGSAVGQLSARFADHRGRIDLAALAVLFDHLGGFPFFRTHLSGTLQARLSLSMLGHVDVDDRLTGTARLRMNEGGFGSTAVEIATSTGCVCCIGTARNVKVGRSADIDPATHDTIAAPRSADAHGVLLPPAIPAGMPGADVITEIAAGVRPIGPIAEMLGGSIDVLPDGGLRLTCTTAPWMGNFFGTMHGGVIAAIIAQAASFAAHLHAAQGKEHQVGDLVAGFYRSPAVNGSDVIVDVVPVKTGRRIGSFEATMHSHDGMLLSRASVDATYR